MAGHTATYAKMPISRLAYEEIRALLEDAGYYHCFIETEDGPLVLQGIGLIPVKEREDINAPRNPPVFCKHCGRSCLAITESFLERGLCTKCDAALSDDGA